MVSVKKEGDTCNLINSSIFIRERGFIVKNLINEDEKIQAYHLRHRVFCQELGWVPESGNALEIDDYDKNAIFFGVFDEYNKLVGFLRLILPNGYFMLEKEFASLVGTEYTLRKERDAAEVSRLCVASEARKVKITGDLGTYNISMFLFKGVYLWCIKNKIRYLYLVVEHKIYRFLRARGFPCEMIGEPTTMPDGVIALAAIMDWREFEVLNAVRRPEMFKWFITLEGKSHSSFGVYPTSISSCSKATATA